MSDANLHDRLTRLERRLERLEQILGVATEVPLPRVTQPEPPPAPQPTPPPLPVAVEPIIEPAEFDQPEFHPARIDLEQTIGLKWAGWIGAIVLVIGFALGIKYAYDQGWLGTVPPAVRLAFMYVGGFVLLGTGEYVYRRIDRIAAAGLFGAGVATLFLVSYAGHGHYQLYAREIAFVLMGLSTLVGAAVAMRGRLVSIAALSVLGGNVAPLVLEEDLSRIIPFLFYLLMLQIVTLTLAWWGNSGKWWTLRWLSLATTALWVLSVLSAGDRYFNPHGAPLVFCLIFAALYQAELIASALRSTTAPPVDAADPSSETGQRGVVFSTLVTALLTAAVLWIFSDATDPVRTAWVLGLSLLCALLGFTLTLRRNRTLHPLAIAYRIQAAALVIVAVPVALSGPWVTLLWGALALAFAAVGARLHLNISRVAGVVTWLLALANLSLWTEQNPDAHSTWLTLFEQNIAAYVILAWIMVWTGHGVAWLVSYRPIAGSPPETHGFAGTGRLVSYLASGVWVVATLQGLPPLGATASLLLYVALLCAAQFFAGRLHFILQSDLVLFLAAVKWLGSDTVVRRFAREWSAADYAPLFNAQVAVGLLLIAALAALLWLHRRRFPDAVDRQWSDAFLPAAGFLSILIALWIGSFEIDRFFEQAHNDRAKQVALSIFWSLFAIGCVVAGFRFRTAGLRYFGLGLFALTLLKVFFIDLAHVSQGYRILSFLGLGLLLLGTSVLYGKLSPKLLGELRETD